MFPRYGAHPGASPTVCFAAPPLDACGFAARRCAPTPGWTPPLGLPKGLKIKSQIKSQSQSQSQSARAGSTGPFPFPFDEGKEYSIAKHANTYGAADGYNFTAPAGSFPANAFGVYDMHGNIYEWTADCYNDNYVGAPSDGSAWLSGKCEVRRIRGNDWGEAPVFSRSGNRNATYTDTRGDWIGFRVARDL